MMRSGAIHFHYNMTIMCVSLTRDKTFIVSAAETRTVLYVCIQDAFTSYFSYYSAIHDVYFKRTTIWIMETMTTVPRPELTTLLRTY